MSFIRMFFAWIASLFSKPSTSVAVPPSEDTSGDTTMPESSTQGGEKYALLIGINKYMIPNADLRGCVNDVENMWDLLTTKFGFKPDNIRVLTDERATMQGILERLEWLVAQAKPGDQLVLQYSGHGSRVRDRGELDELDDALDECICPTDHSWDNPLVDDIIATYFKRVPASVLFTFVCDSCHSGSMTRGGLEPPGNPHPVLERYLAPPFDIAARSLGRDLAINRIGEKSVEGTRAIGDVHVLSQNHILISGCRDDQTSADAYIDGKYQGALTSNLLKIVRENPEYDWKHIHELLLKAVQLGGYTQVPQLTGSEPLLESVPFGG